MNKNIETHITDIPQDCLAKIIQSTTPKDASRISSTAKIFRSIADSDAVWDHFLPSDHLSGKDSKKQTYLRLSGAGILIDGGTKHFSVNRPTGKKRLIIGARNLHIVWGEDERYWKWVRVRGSRFRKIAKLNSVWWLEIRTRIRTRELSPGTNYGVYLIFKMSERKYGFVASADVSVEVTGEVKKTRSAYLDVDSVRAPEEIGEDAELPAKREDGWSEVEMGEFFIGDGDGDRDVEVSLMETKGLSSKGGLIVEGIEFRPK